MWLIEETDFAFIVSLRRLSSILHISPFSSPKTGAKTENRKEENAMVKMMKSGASTTCTHPHMVVVGAVNENGREAERGGATLPSKHSVRAE